MDIMKYPKKFYNGAISMTKPMVNGVGRGIDTVTRKAAMEHVVKFAQETDAVNTAIVTRTHEVFSHLDNLDGSGLESHLIDGNMLNEHLGEHVRAEIDAAEMTPEFHFPLIAFGMIALQNIKGYLEGKKSGKEAIRSGAPRGWRTLVCRAAAYVSILISHEPVVGLPTSILTEDVPPIVDS